MQNEEQKAEQPTGAGMEQNPLLGAGLFNVGFYYNGQLSFLIAEKVPEAEAWSIAENYCTAYCDSYSKTKAGFVAEYDDRCWLVEPCA
ncbi:MAG TPA: hypothetical protein VFT06_00380 [Flavisolibacter sp.]|nr:hypothetical protein [Flavisolibacter sp.]